jgi:hypothetical protein
MESTFELTPESARALALRLFTKEQFQADPKGLESQKPVTPVQSALINRLDELTKTKGVEAVAKGVGVNHQTLRSWLYRGIVPNEVNRLKVEQFPSSETSPAVAGAEEPAKPSELFGQPQGRPEPESQ